MSKSDFALSATLRLCAGISASIVLLLFIYIGLEGMPALRGISLFRFVGDPSWHPTEGLYNMSPMILGTFLTTLGALLLAFPLGLASAVFCRYVAPPVWGRLYRRMIELMAGIPSVVYGFWGLVMLVPRVREIAPPGPSLLAGILVLCLMILPTLALIMDASFARVPSGMLRGAEALALSRWSTLKHIVFPVARSGMLTSVVLSLGRAIGETMAILMVSGNVVRFPDSLFSPLRSLTANIALEMAYAMDLHRSALFVSALMLALMVVVLIFLADVLPRKALS
jgi:phosphate transport system permease protein